MTTSTLKPFSRGPTGAHVRSYQGLRFGFLADAADTGGAYSLMEVTALPGAEPPPHMHNAEDEAFYILDGAWTFRCGEALTDATPGTLLFLPRGLVHGFTAHNNLCRALVILSPGGLEEVFRDFSEPLPGSPAGASSPAGPPPLARMIEAFGGHGVHFSPPAASFPPAG